MKKLLFGAAVATVLALAACATTTSMPAAVESGVLVGPNRMTLYTFANDPAGGGKSVCVDKCAINWPPFAAGAYDQGSGDWSVIARNDGSKQWAYKGKPLYFWIKDQKPGDRTGDGFNKVWSVARP